MKVIVPFSSGKLQETVVKVLNSYRLPVRYELLVDALDYSRLLRQMWREGETFVIVEQDILPWPGAIEELFYCPGQWCSCSYPYGGAPGIYHMLGCTKISSQLMLNTPHLWDTPVHWSQCDVHLRDGALSMGQEPHPHRPPAIHLNPKEIG